MSIAKVNGLVSALLDYTPGDAPEVFHFGEYIRPGTCQRCGHAPSVHRRAGTRCIGTRCRCPQFTPKTSEMSA